LFLQTPTFEEGTLILTAFINYCSMPFYPGEWVIGIGESTISVLGDYVAGKSHLLNRFSFKFF